MPLCRARPAARSSRSPASPGAASCSGIASAAAPSAPSPSSAGARPKPAPSSTSARWRATMRGSAAIAIEPRNSSAAISRVTKRGRPVADAVDKYALRLRTRRPWCRSRRRSGLGSASAAALGSTGSRDFMGSTAMPG